MEEDIELGKTELMFGLFMTNIERLRITMDYTEQALRDVIESDKTTLKIWSLCMNMTTDLLATLSFVKQLGEARKNSIEYDYYNEIRDIIDELDNRLTRFNKVCLTDIGDEILDLLFDHSENVKIIHNVSRNIRAKIETMDFNHSEDLKMFEGYKNLQKKLRKEYSTEEQFENFINFTQADVFTQLLALPVYLELLIKELKTLTMLQYERSNEDLLRIYEREKKEYERNIFADKWRNYLSQLQKTTFRFKPMTSFSLQEVYEELCKTLKELPLGIVYLADYDTEEKRGYEYNRLQCRHSEWGIFFYTSLKYEYLCDMIEKKKEEENRADPDFKTWVDVPKLQEYASTWINANIKEQYQWTVVFSVFHELKLLRNDCEPERLSERLNRLFPNAPKPCVWGSIRKDIGKKWDNEKKYLQPITTWDKEDRLLSLATSFYNKLKDKDKYINSEF